MKKEEFAAKGKLKIVQSERVASVGGWKCELLGFRFHKFTFFN